MTIREALKKYHKLEIDLLLEAILKKPKEFLYTNMSRELTSRESRVLLKFVKRRSQGEPIAYILGYKYFYGFKIKVNKYTLIPRPETEWIVSGAIKVLATRDPKLVTILDMGTGSGCIAITLFKNLNSLATIHAADISERALKIAKFNARTHKAKVKFFTSNLFSKLPYKYDVIIANLPYVPISVYKKLMPNLKFEPKLALTDGTDTGELISNFLNQLPGHLNSNAQVLLEFDPMLVPYISKILKKVLPKAKFQIYNDLQKLSRYGVISLE